jgi:hypothetical protein
MNGPKLKHRVESLEDLMAALLRAAERTEIQVERTSRELSEFKDEMRTFAFKEERRVDIGDAKADIVESRRQWGELADRLGTMAEDLVRPNIPLVLRQVLGLSDGPIDSAVRVRRHSSADPSVEREFAVVATCGDYLLINETKSRLAAEDVARFVEALATVRDYFPEHSGKKVVGAIASLYVDPAVVRRGEAMGLIVLGFGEDVMAVLNSPGFVPRTF